MLGRAVKTERERVLRAAMIKRLQHLHLVLASLQRVLSLFFFGQCTRLHQLHGLALVTVVLLAIDHFVVEGGGRGEWVQRRLAAMPLLEHLTRRRAALSKRDVAGSRSRNVRLRRR